MVASGNEVGKISIRVVPNLEDFHDDLKRQLADEEKKRHKVSIGANTKPLSRDIDKAVDKPRKAEVGVDFDKSFAERALADLQKNLDAIRATGKDIALFEAAAEGLERKVRNVPVEPELVRGWEDDIRLELARMKALSVEIDTDLGGGAKLQAEMAAELAKLQTLASLSKIQVPVEVNVDRNRIGRSLEAIVGGIGRLGAGLGTSVANGLYNIGSAAISAGKGFLRLGENGMIAVAVLGLIAPALALVSGALVTLPAALATLAVTAGTVALGMDGIKKAAEKAGLYGDSNGDKKGGGELGAALQGLKQTVSDVFENSLTPAFVNIAKLADSLKESFGGVAQGLSDMFSGFTEALTGGSDQVGNIISNIGKAFSQATPGIKDFTTGILNLVSELSNKFPGLADAFNRTGKSFLEWVDKITTKDAVTGVSQLDTAMTQLGDTLSRIGGLATTFFKSGWENLSNVDFGKSMSGFVESVDRLVNVTLPQLANAFEGIAAALRPVVVMVETIDSILSGLKAKLPSADDFTAAFTGEGSPNKLVFGDRLGGWIDELTGNEYSAKAQAAGAKLATDLSEGLAQGLEAGIELGSPSFTGLENIGPAVSQQIKDAINVSAEDQKQALRSAFTADGVDAAVAQQLTTQITQAIESAKGAMANLGPELQAQIDAATMPLASIGDKVGEAFSTLGPAVATAWQGVVTSLTAGTTEISTAVTTAFTGLSTSATTAFQGIQTSITGAFGFMVLAIGQQAQNINTAVGQAFSQIPATITTSLAGVLQAVVGAFAGIPAAIGGALSGVPGAIASAMTPAIGVVQAVMEGIINLVNVVGGQVAAVAAATFAQFPPAVQGAMAPAVTAVGTIGQQMVAAALSFGGAMESAGRSIGASFAAGIASSSGLVSAAASSLMAAARAFFPNSPAKEGPFSGSGWVDKSGEAVGDGFASGLSSSQQEVVATARALMQAVKDIFGSAEGLTLNFNMGAVTEQAEAATKQVQVFGDTLSKVPTGPLNDLAVASGAGGLSAADSKAQRDELSQQLDLLEMERKSLELEKGRAGANNDAIKARLAEIKEQKLQLGLQKDQLDYAKKYGAETEQTGGKVDQFYRDMGEKIFKMPTDFARAIGAQFTQDLGISGQGAIPQLLEQGSQFIFQVANMDTALSAQQTLQRRQGMGLVGRTS